MGQARCVAPSFGIISFQLTYLLKLFCITADNASNNDTACDKIEQLLHQCKIYSFNSLQHRLPCLAHVINLSVIAIMSTITKIANVENMSSIWDFNPTLPKSHIFEGSLDVITAVRTLAVKVCYIYLTLCSGLYVLRRYNV